MNVANIIEWMTNNWQSLVSLYLQIIGLASIIVKLTPSLKDDDVLKNVLRFLGKYVALNAQK